MTRHLILILKDEYFTGTYDNIVSERLLTLQKTNRSASILHYQLIINKFTYKEKNPELLIANSVCAGVVTIFQLVRVEKPNAKKSVSLNGWFSVFRTINFPRGEWRIRLEGNKNKQD